MRTRTTGFTLIELMTVASIIAVMLTILLPAVGRIRSQALTDQANRILYAIATGVDSYKNDFGDYPPSEPDRVDEGNEGVADNTGDWGPRALHLYLNGARGEGYAPGGRHYDPRVEGVKTMSTGSYSGTRYLFLDTWGNIVQYFRARRYKVSGGSVSAATTTAEIYPRACNVDLDGSGVYRYEWSGQGSWQGSSTVAGESLLVPVERWNASWQSSHPDDLYTDGWQHQSVPINASSYLLVSAGADQSWGTTDDLFNSR